MIGTEERAFETVDPMIAVIVPVYNSGVFLRDALESVQKQTVSVEIIVVDDGSVDPTTLEILENLDLSGARVLRHNVNKGTAAALNTGISHAHAPIISILASDDMFEPILCERVVNVFDGDSAIDIVSYDLRLFGDRTGILEAQSVRRGIVDLLLGNPIPGASSFRKSVWTSVGGFSESIRYGEDWDFWVKALSMGKKPVTLHESLYNYRQHSTQKRASLSRERSDSMNLAVMLSNKDVWADHIDDVLTECWRQYLLLRSFKRRYGWINDKINDVRGIARRCFRS